MKHHRNIDMCNGPLFKNIVLYTIPIILTGILQLLFNAADLVVVGRYCGSVCVAAVGATTSLNSLIVNLFIGLSVGTGVKTAQAIGAKDIDAIHQNIHTSIPAAIIGGLILTLIGVFGSEYFLTLMGTPEDVLPLSAVYMRIYFCGMTFTMLYNFGASILRAAGDTQGPLRYLTIAGVANVLLNLCFVIFFKMDVAGVALATAISQAISAILVLNALIHRTDACRFNWKEMKIHPRTLLGIMRIGIPAGLQGSMFSISNVIIQSSINSFGSVVMSGHSAASNIEGFINTSMNAFHQTSLNFTGQNYGAKKYNRIGKISGICLICVTVLGFVMGQLSYHFGETLLSIYITDSPESIQYGLLRMAYISLPYFICGMMDTMSGSIRGMGVAMPPMLISLVGVCGIRVGWIYTIFAIPKYHTLESIYISYPISWAATFVALLVLFLVLYRSCIKKHKREQTVQSIQ